MMKQKELIVFLKNYNQTLPKGIQLTGLFGSYARGTADIYSDIDLTYHMDHSIFYPENAFKKLIVLEEIKKELEQKLKHPIDLIPENTKDPLLAESLKQERIAL